MSEIAFYHLTRSRLEEALPRLLEKVLEAGKRAVVRGTDPERIEHLARVLWTYERDSFLPHGTQRDGFPERQPVWLTTEAENPNRAQVLVLVDGAEHEGIEGFERVLDLFDGNDPEQLERARGRWKAARAAGHTLTYWRQDERGRWRRER
ncbi:hypothetical protein HRbin39_00688 [bacterium HR39]|nr:hypothetical protein HRbin39_00688 [bacterium HR39]